MLHVRSLLHCESVVVDLVRLSPPLACSIFPRIVVIVIVVLVVVVVIVRWKESLR